MKQMFIFILLFSLVTGLGAGMDLIQGLGLIETLEGFKRIKQLINSEEYILILLFFLPLLLSKSNKYLKSKQVSSK